MDSTAAIANYHEDRATIFAANNDGKSRHVECRIADLVYVYLHEDAVHIQTQEIEIPKRWWNRWPSEATVKTYIHLHARIGGVRITTLDA